MQENKKYDYTAVMNLEGKLSDVKVIETKTGKPMTAFSIKCGLFYDGVAFDELATKLASLQKGDRVKIAANPKLNEYTNKDGAIVKKMEYVAFKIERV